MWGADPALSWTLVTEHSADLLSVAAAVAVASEAAGSHVGTGAAAAFVTGLMWFHRVPYALPDPQDRQWARDVWLAPAWGTVHAIGPRHVSLFLNVTDIHVQVAPTRMTLTAAPVFRDGEYCAAWHPCSDRNAMLISEWRTAAGARVRVKQISGIFARNMVCRAQPGQTVPRGALWGLIRFGSRVDLELLDGPENGQWEPLAAMGEHVQGARTPLVRWVPS